MASRASREDRTSDRDEVHFRVKGFGPDATRIDLVIVNVSIRGLMARCETGYQPGDRISTTLPVIGPVIAEIRWSLGGRIGCELEKVIDRAVYDEMLKAMLATG